MKKRRVSIEERARRYLESISKYGDKRRAKAYRTVGEMEQCKIVGSILGESLRAATDGHYYLTCPGVQMHSNKSGRKDCRFTPAGKGTASNGVSAASLHCVHQSCANIIADFNHKIRSAIGKAGVEYVTDHGSTLNNAAAALVIGFDMDDLLVNKLLCAWGKTCTPSHSASACGQAINRARDAYRKKPDEIGYLLKSNRAAARPSPQSPTKDLRPYYALAHDLGADKDYVVVDSKARYIGDRGKIADQVQAQIESYAADHGEWPTAILLGPDQPALSGKMFGLPIEHMRTPGISVYGENVDASYG